MENPFFLENCIAILLIIFGFTSLKIFKEVRERDCDTVDSVINKKGWWFSGNKLHLGKFFKVYKSYYDSKGLNLILILNILSYVLAFVIVFKITTS